MLGGHIIMENIRTDKQKLYKKKSRMDWDSWSYSPTILT